MKKKNYPSFSSNRDRSKDTLMTIGPLTEEDFKMLYLHYLLLVNAGIRWDPSLEQNFNPMSDNLVEIGVVQ